MYTVKQRTEIISIPVIDNLNVVIMGMLKVGHSDPVGTKGKICNWLTRLLECSNSVLYNVEIDEYKIQQQIMSIVRSAVVLLTIGNIVINIEDTAKLISGIIGDYTEVLMKYNIPVGNYNVISFDVNEITVLRITNDEIQSK